MKTIDAVKPGNDRTVRWPFFALLLGIATNATLVGAGFCGHAKSSAQEPAKEPVRPAPEVIADWEKAGAEFGWIRTSPEGFARWRSAKEKVEANDLPGFRFRKFLAGKLPAHPSPEAPFGLWLEETQITDAGLTELAGLKELQTLNLGLTPVTGAGLKELAGLKRLRTLYLYGAKTTDAGLKEVARLTALQTLGIEGTKVSDAGLKELAGMKDLRRLFVGFSQVTDAGLKELRGLAELQTLYLGYTRVTDAGLKDLSAMTNLQTLALDGTKVTDAGLKLLLPLEKLQTLYLGKTRVTDAGAAQLQKALPKLKIQR